MVKIHFDRGSKRDLFGNKVQTEAEYFKQNCKKQ